MEQLNIEQLSNFPTFIVAPLNTFPEMSSKAGLFASTRLSMVNPRNRLSPNLCIGLLER